MKDIQNRGPSSTATGGRLQLRGFQDQSDFDSIADICNTSAVHHEGSKATVVEAKRIENITSTTERIQIAEVDGTPVSFILVTKEGAMQLDEYGTCEGKMWMIMGPTSLPEYENTDVEESLLHWVIASAREGGVSTLLRLVKPAQKHMRELLEHNGFHIAQQYYFMQVEMTEPPPAPRSLPGGLDLIDCHSEKDIEMLWSVLEAAFDYKDNREAYESLRRTFRFLKAAYIPLCIEKDSQQPIGTIVAVEMKTKQGTNGAIAIFGVIPSHQGKGIGSALMERALNHFWQSGVKSVELIVRAKNRKATRVYERFGFQIVPARTVIVLEKIF